MKRVVSRSGHHTFRVSFNNSSPHQKEEVIKELKTMQSLELELYSDNLLLIDVPDVESAGVMRVYLAEKEADHWLEYEDGDSGGQE
jgi:hypothetical protein